MNYRSRITVFGLALSILAAAVAATFSQSASGQSGSRGAPSRAGSGTRVQTFEEKFWSYLQTAQYRNWAPMPGVSGDAIPGQQPHGAMVRIYANRKAVANPAELPNGSIIIKENLGEDGTSLMAVTLMYRVKGYDRANGDWFWAKYEPNGMVSQMNGMKLSGKVAMCAECHSSAEGNDFSFTNDRGTR